MKEWDDQLCPKAIFVLEKNKDQHRFWSTTFNGDKEFEVNNGPNGYVVDFNDKTCTCRMWELNGIPYSHPISAIYYMKDDPDNYVSDWFEVTKAKQVYGFYLKGVNSEKMWKK